MNERLLEPVSVSPRQKVRGNKLRNLASVCAEIGLAAVLAAGTADCKSGSERECTPCVCDKSKAVCPDDPAKLFEIAASKYKAQGDHKAFNALMEKACKKSPRLILSKIEKDPEIFKTHPDVYLNVVDMLLEEPWLLEYKSANSYKDELTNMQLVDGSVRGLKPQCGPNELIVLEMARWKMHTAMFMNAEHGNSGPNAELTLSELQAFDRPEVRNYLRTCAIAVIASEKLNTDSWFIVRSVNDEGEIITSALDVKKLERLFQIVEQLEGEGKDLDAVKEKEFKYIVKSAVSDLFSFSANSFEMKERMHDLMDYLKKFPRYEHLIKPVAEICSLSDKLLEEDQKYNEGKENELDQVANVVEAHLAHIYEETASDAGTKNE